MVFQDPSGSLNPRQTAFAAIAEPIRRLGPLTRNRPLTTVVQELAEMVALPMALLSRLPHQLSGGEKARLGIARAIGRGKTTCVSMGCPMTTRRSSERK
jgi:peptide/nickel transport system ATP-binding protein